MYVFTEYCTDNPILTAILVASAVLMLIFDILFVVALCNAKNEKAAVQTAVSAPLAKEECALEKTEIAIEQIPCQTPIQDTPIEESIEEPIEENVELTKEIPAEEIAEETQTSMNTVKTHIRRAREMLKKSYRKELLQE